MLKVVFVLGCLLCLTLANSDDDSASSREDRSLRGPHPPRGHGPPGKPCHPSLPDDFLQKLLEFLRTSTTTTTTAATTTAAASTTAGPTTADPNTTVPATP